MTDDDGCKDIDECEAVPCEENQYCMNTEGSYACATCHKACLGCSGYGADKCDACKEGYRKPEETNNCIGKGFFFMLPLCVGGENRFVFVHVCLCPNILWHT